MRTGIFTLIIRYLLGKNRRGYPRAIGPIIAIALGIATVLLVLNITNSMIRGIVARFIETGSYHMKASSIETHSNSELTEYARILHDNPVVTNVFPERRGVGLLAFGDQRRGVTIRAISPALWSDDAGFRQNIEVLEGEFTLNGYDILLGADSAAEFKVAIGDTVRLITLRRSESIHIPRVRNFTVRGIFSAGYRDLDRQWVFIPFDVSTTILDVAATESLLGIKTTDPFALSNPISRAPYTRNISQELREIEGALGDEFLTRSWYQQHAARFLNFRATKNILLLIAALIVCVALTHIISSLSILTIDKVQEIAILKALGMLPDAIRALFIGCGFCIGLFGSIIGAVIGTFLSLNINHILSAVEYAVGIGQRLFGSEGALSLTELREEFYLETIPVVISPIDMYLFVLVAVFLSMGAAYIPARRAAAVAPLATIQNR